MIQISIRQESVHYPAVYATCTGRLMLMLGLDARTMA